MEIAHTWLVMQGGGPHVVHIVANYLQVPRGACATVCQGTSWFRMPSRFFGVCSGVEACLQCEAPLGGPYFWPHVGDAVVGFQRKVGGLFATYRLALGGLCGPSGDRAAS